MRFIADKNCDFSVIRALRATDHDVVPIMEDLSGAADEAIIDLAVRERRILLTEDGDFGQLVYAGGYPSSGIIFMRFPARARHTLSGAVLNLVNQEGGRLVDSFVVIQPGRVRITRHLVG